MKSSAQLERESEEARTDVVETLDQLRARASPGQLVDQFVDYARRGSGALFFRNLGRQVVDNPLPVTLVGAGLAWLMIQSAAGGTTRPQRSAGDALGTVREGIGDAMSTAADSVRAAGAGIGDSMGDAADSASAAVRRIRDGASSAYGAATHAAARRGATSASVGRGVAAGSRRVAEFSREQPLVMGGIGIALGAALGAALPFSEAEDQLMGEASDEVKGATQRLAREAMAQGKGAYEEAKQSVRRAAEESTASGSEPDRETERVGSRTAESDAAPGGNAAMAESAVSTAANDTETR
jgi:hypothetical protein